MKNFDNSFLCDSIQFVAGIDEAGRGPLAGPVVAAAVVFKPETVIQGVNDSKKLTAAKREELYEIITSKAVSWSVGIMGQAEIDSINILQATLRAMSNALSGLKVRPDLVLIDGNKVCQTDIQAQAIIKGDEKSFCIAAASIIAKVTRDRLMTELSDEYPAYLWHKNKGYGTKEHIEALIACGPSPVHRKTFLNNFFKAQNGTEHSQ